MHRTLRVPLGIWIGLAAIAIAAYLVWLSRDAPTPRLEAPPAGSTDRRLEEWIAETARLREKVAALEHEIAALRQHESRRPVEVDTDGASKIGEATFVEAHREELLELIHEARAAERSDEMKRDVQDLVLRAATHPDPTLLPAASKFISDVYAPRVRGTYERFTPDGAPLSRQDPLPGWREAWLSAWEGWQNGLTEISPDLPLLLGVKVRTDVEERIRRSLR